MTRRSAGTLIILAALAAPGAWLLLRERSDSPPHPAEAVPAGTTAESGDSSAQVQLAALDSSLRAIADGDSLAPRDRWDPAYVVRTVGGRSGPALRVGPG
jgi:hypothetical protein